MVPGLQPLNGVTRHRQALGKRGEDLACRELAAEGFREILTHHADQPHICKEAAAECEVDGRPAQYICNRAMRRLHVIDPNGSRDDK